MIGQWTGLGVKIYLFFVLLPLMILMIIGWQTREVWWAGL
ncbi:hypothetical protein EVA_13828 [gut metagenome]|uniref:Uncharacterized protein n=1 Tax=gut metagenome TaxID=749906 RepID=J9FU87_9ZZZZ